MGTPAHSPIWQTDGADKREAVRRMFGDIAPHYDLVNFLMSLSMHGRWRRAAVATLDLHEGDAALDVCCGTGDFMSELRRAVGTQGRVFGVDFCRPMLEVARSKGVGPVGLGDACELPIRSETVDAVTVGWGIRNVADIDKAHSEIHRVLKPGGRFASIDMARPRNRWMRGICETVCWKIVPWLGSVIGRCEAYTYLSESTRRFWTREELKSSMERAGLSEVGFRDLCFGNICIHYGKKI